MDFHKSKQRAIGVLSGCIKEMTKELASIETSNLFEDEKMIHLEIQAKKDDILAVENMQRFITNFNKFSTLRLFKK